MMGRVWNRGQKGSMHRVASTAVVDLWFQGCEVFYRSMDCSVES